MQEKIKEHYIKKLNNMSEKDHFCLYIDLPFCRSKCVYCIYNSLSLYKNLELRKKYSEAIMKQLDFYKELFDIRTPDSIYFGGGTPSLWELDELLEIKKRISGYESIKSKKTEAHPYDMTPERIKFYSNQLGINIVSLGVQSFDRDSCIGQKRIWVDEVKTKEIVERFHESGVLVNIDLVALFNGDGEENWEIFEKDIEKACTFVHPDVITSIPNYKTSLVYLEQIPRFRTILRKYTGETYFPLSEQMLSLKPEVIQHYGKNDHWIATKDYWYYHDTHFRYSSSNPSGHAPDHQVVLAIGGAMEHQIYGYISDDYVVYSGYDFEKKEFVYRALEK